MMQKISIIIPCYNVESWIDRCLESVTLQTLGLDNLEIICVDDASTDLTWQRLQVWERRYPDNMILVHQPVNRRQGAARNLGLQYATGEWISFVDADDWLEPDCLEQLYLPTEKYECDVVCCSEARDSSEHLCCFDDRIRNMEEEDQYIVADRRGRREYLMVTFAMGEAAWGKIIRRNLLMDAQIFFPENLAYEDMYWHSLLHIYTEKVFVIKKRLYHYFINEHSTALMLNESYHMDWATVWMLKWEVYRERNLLQNYEEELEYDCMHDAVGYLKTMILRYDEPSFSSFQLGRAIIKEIVPDYRGNRYLEGFSDIYKVLLEALYVPVNREEFQQIVKLAKMYWRVSR